MQPLRNLGGYIREQRNVSQISLRQLAAAAGVSNPYLSQIERGMRKPSAEILQQIAKALRISAEALYVQAGMLDERLSGSEVSQAIHTDLQLSERQKQVLLEIYDSFCKENESAAARSTRPTSTPSPADDTGQRTPARRPAKKAAKKAQKRAVPRKTTAKKATKATRTPATKTTS
ncbi:MAG: helix-turn-helix transcriptional regulator [Mycobacteriales bacterium]